MKSLGDKTLAALIEENEASAEVTTVYAEATRGVDWVNNFWKAIANHPATLKRLCQAGHGARRFGSVDE